MLWRRENTINMASSSANLRASFDTCDKTGTGAYPEPSPVTCGRGVPELHALLRHKSGQATLAALITA
jgi:hypothetical protein